MGVILDTSIWVAVERGRLTPAEVEAVTGKDPVYLSPITVAELEYGIQCAPDKHSRMKRQAALARLRSRPCLSIDSVTGELVGQVLAKLNTAGKATQHRLHDIWMACQALQHNLGLLTLNGRDFKDIPGLRLLEIKTGRISVTKN
jgi:predicted nucleic acid-binding protein